MYYEYLVIEPSWLIGSMLFCESITRYFSIKFNNMVGIILRRIKIKYGRGAATQTNSRVFRRRVRIIFIMLLDIICPDTSMAEGGPYKAFT